MSGAWWLLKLVGQWVGGAAVFALVLHLLTGGRRRLPVQTGFADLPGPREPDFRILLRVDDVMVRLSRGLAWTEQPARLQFVREIPHPTSSVPTLHVLLEVQPSVWVQPSPRHDTGDPALTGKLMVGCEPELLAAALDAAARRCLLEVIEGKLEHHPGLVNIARRLSSRRSLDELSAALLQNARQDPLDSVRLRNFQALVDRFGSDPAVDQFALAALTDSDPHLRVAAAAQRPGGAAPQALEAILREVAFGEHPGALRAKAVKILGALSSETDPEITNALLQLTREPDDQVRRAAFGQLRARGWQPDSGALALAGGEGGELSLPKEKKRAE